MAYDKALAERVRRALDGAPEVREINMMGALVFMAGGHMCCGASGDRLMVRLGPEGSDAALAEPHVEPMEVGGGRRPQGFVRVRPEGIAEDAALRAWMRRALAFIATLPPKRR